MNPRVILGLNAYHADSAAALIVDGETVAAAEEERFVRVKHWTGFPAHAIRWCVDASGTRPEQIDAVAINTDPGAARWQKLKFLIQGGGGLGLVLDRIRVRSRRQSVLQELRQILPGMRSDCTLVGVEHHVAHLASAFYPSPFERAAVISVDGMGDFASCAWGIGTDKQIDVLGRVHFPHSLGIFYQAMTQFLGFPNYGDEYKVMGLAPYGDATEVERIGRLVETLPNGTFRLNLAYFQHHDRQTASVSPDGTPAFQDLFSPKLEALLGPRRQPQDPLTQREKNLARSTQVVYERCFFSLLRHVHESTGQNQLCLAGGCAQNSVANGKITLETPFKKVYVAAAGYDAGGAIGAAMEACRANGRPRSHGAYLGPAFTTESIRQAIDKRADELRSERCEILEFAPPSSDGLKVVCDSLVSGGVVGWFQGGLEWGARALGNRSILADPRRPDMKDILNRKIKRRESFRPFAPSVLRERVADWFEQDMDVPFMSQVVQIRSEKRAFIPAVTHVDGSGRLQTVDSISNPKYHALIRAFEAKTGVPMLLNTSFNENEPIVCRPEEALDCFLRTRMDLLVIGDFILKRPN